MGKIFLAGSMLLAMFVVGALAQDDELIRGVELYREGKYQEAADVLQRVVYAEPKNKFAWMYLGGAFENLGRHKEALSAFKKKGDGKPSRLTYEKELDVTGKVKAEYTDDEALQRHLQGNVVLVVEFKADGNIGFIVVLRDLSDGLTKSAVNATRAMTFRPAVSDGKPVPVIRLVSYDFLIK